MNRANLLSLLDGILPKLIYTEQELVFIEAQIDFRKGEMIIRELRGFRKEAQKVLEEFGGFPVPAFTTIVMRQILRTITMDGKPYSIDTNSCIGVIVAIGAGVQHVSVGTMCVYSKSFKERLLDHTYEIVKEESIDEIICSPN